MWQDYCRNCGCRQDAHPEFVDRKPEGDAGQTESNALRAAVHRRALESQRAERAEEQVRQLTAKLASRAETERELLENLETCAGWLENVSEWEDTPRSQAIEMREDARKARDAVAKYLEGK